MQLQQSKVHVVGMGTLSHLEAVWNFFTVLGFILTATVLVLVLPSPSQSCVSRPSQFKTPDKTHCHYQFVDVQWFSLNSTSFILSFSAFHWPDTDETYLWHHFSFCQKFFYLLWLKWWEVSWHYLVLSLYYKPSSHIHCWNRQLSRPETVFSLSWHWLPWSHPSIYHTYKISQTVLCQLPENDKPKNTLITNMYKS